MRESQVYQLTDGVTVHASRVCLQMSTTIVAGSDATLVADPGWFPDEIEHQRALAAATPAGRATHVVLTHPDVDHIAGWDEFGPVTLIAHPLTGQRDAARLEAEVAAIDAEYGFTGRPPYRFPSVESMTSPASLDLGDETALFFAAPGHTRDGLFTVLPRRRVLIAGDYLGPLEGPYVFHSLRAYRETLDLARELCDRFDIDKLVTGHGPAAVSYVEIADRIRADADYLDRLAAAVAAAMDEGLGVDATVDSLRGFSYRGETIKSLWQRAHSDNIRLVFAQPSDIGR